MSSDPQTKERQYQFLIDLANQEGLQQLGLMSSQVWRDDPRRLLFVLARYKFVAKMFSGLGRVLEVGCADAFGTRIVRQEVAEVVATDFDPVFIERNQARPDPKWPVTFKVHDMLSDPLAENFDGAYALDVLEHIQPADEEQFIRNMAGSLAPHGALMIGSPSLHSQPWASPASKEGHVNCKDGPGLRALMSRHFHNVFLFSMNDEVVHTGFTPMAHYLWALCAHRKA
jgi:2-polyprenyl-3-methyl-5-hydroxy-6-metoxy-1,4-benzoquinol methylase